MAALMLSALLYSAQPAEAAYKRVYVPADVTLISPVSPLFFLPGRVITGVSANLLVGVHNSVYGLEVGTLVNYVREDMIGLQLAGLGNVVKEDGGGIQVAGFVNRAEGTFYGLQLSPVANVAGDGAALQLALFANKATGDLSGLQLSLYNTTKGAPFGLQFGAFNNAFADFTGLQIGLVNWDGASEFTNVGTHYEARARIGRARFSGPRRPGSPQAPAHRAGPCATRHR